MHNQQAGFVQQVATTFPRERLLLCYSRPLPTGLRRSMRRGGGTEGGRV